MPPNSVHVVATDFPPYFLARAGCRVGRERPQHALRCCRWTAYAGMKFDRKQGVKLQEFYDKVSAEVLRVLAPGGFFLSFASPRLYHRMAVAMDDAGFELRDMLVWRYRNGAQQKAFTQDHFVRKMDIPKKEQDKIIKSMNGRKTPQMRPQFEPIAVAQKPREGTFVDNWLKHRTGLIDLNVPRVRGRTPSTVLEIDKPQKESYNSHLTVKPVLLMEVLIRIFSAPGQTVLDPFAGSGSTLLAARNTDREGIGIEVNAEYHAIATNRLEGAPDET